MGRFVVFGGTGGVGRSVVRRLAEAGHGVHLVARDPERLASLATEIGATWSSGDVADPDLFDRVRSATGAASLDGIVYAVGTIRLKPLGRLTDAEMVEDFTVNALGAARAVRALLPQLAASETGASVLLFSSVAVRQGFGAHASIAMAKGAVEGLVSALAAELAPKIRVNAIAPSLLDTDLAKAVTSNEAMTKAIASLHPMQRIGRPEDVADLAALLLGAGGGWITGQVIGVDGGRSTLRTKG